MSEREQNSSSAGGPGQDGDASAAAGGAGFGDGLEIVALRPAPGVVLLSLSGEIDLLTNFRLMDAVSEAYAEGPALLAVDLTEVRFLDAAGLRVLTTSARHIEEARTRFAVICPEESPVGRLLELAGAQRELNVHGSAGEALRPWLGDEEGELSAGERAFS